MTSKPNLIWAVPGLFDRAFEWISKRIRAVFGLDSAKFKTLELSRRQAWQTDFSAPVENLSDLRAALLQALPSLSPITAEESVVYATPHSTEENQLSLLILSTDQHADLIAQKDGYEAFSQKGTIFPFKRTIVKKRVAAGISLAATAALLLLADTALSIGSDRNQEKLASLRSQERAILADLKVRSDASRQQTASERFLALNPAHLTPAGRLALLATLSEATPDTSYWQAINIGDDSVSIEVRSVEAALDLSSLQSSLEDWAVDLSGPISATQDGRERMTLRLRSHDKTEVTQ